MSIHEIDTLFLFYFQKFQLQTLSKLTTTHTDHTINITYDEEDEKCKQKFDIKEENEHSNDSSTNYEEINDFPAQEIKKENVEETKRQQIKKSKSLHYKIVYEKNAKKMLRKKFVIPLDFSKTWLEREKDSDFYKKFKFKCKSCVNGFNVKEKLKRHVLKYHDEVSIACQFRFHFKLAAET